MVMGVELPLEIEWEAQACLELNYSPDFGPLIDLYVGDSREDFGNASIPFGDLVDELIENAPELDSQAIYCIAHEMRRHAERLYEIAQTMEDAGIYIADGE